MSTALPRALRTSRVVAQPKVTVFVADAEELAAVPLQHRGEPSDIADVGFLLSPLAAFLTCQLLAAHGGATIV